MPDARRRLERVRLFICATWTDRWFSDQKLRVADFTELEEALEPYQAALECLKRHWKQEPSRIYIPRSKQCCKWAIKWCRKSMLHVRTRATFHFNSSLLTGSNKHFETFSGLFYSTLIPIICFLVMLSKAKLSLVVLWSNMHFLLYSGLYENFISSPGGLFFKIWSNEVYFVPLLAKVHPNVIQAIEVVKKL